MPVDFSAEISQRNLLFLSQSQRMKVFQEDKVVAFKEEEKRNEGESMPQLVIPEAIRSGCGAGATERQESGLASGRGEGRQSIEMSSLADGDEENFEEMASREEVNKIKC